jgi:hypothetical protein
MASSVVGDFDVSALACFESKAGATPALTLPSHPKRVRVDEAS